MKKVCTFLVVVLLAVAMRGADQPKIPALPEALANNAVARLRGGAQLFSIMGLGPRKTWKDVSNRMYVLHMGSDTWVPGPDLPGVAGRLGASAAGAQNRVYVFGGYIVDKDGNEIIVPDVNAFIPNEHRWYRAPDMPVAVDDAVVGVLRDRYIYIIGGRSNAGPVNKVQVYDAQKNAWSEATPYPGTPVFGHAGGLVQDTIVYIDGAARNTASGAPYVASDQCWMGKIEPRNPHKIVWTKLPDDPGTARFGIAGGSSEKEHRIYFSGGTSEPHNYKGLDYHGKAVEPAATTFYFDLRSNSWDFVGSDTPEPRLDARGLLSTPQGMLIVGGMLQGQTITKDVTVISVKKK